MKLSDYYSEIRVVGADGSKPMIEMRRHDGNSDAFYVPVWPISRAICDALNAQMRKEQEADRG